MRADRQLAILLAAVVGLGILYWFIAGSGSGSHSPDTVAAGTSTPYAANGSSDIDAAAGRSPLPETQSLQAMLASNHRVAPPAADGTNGEMLLSFQNEADYQNFLQSKLPFGTEIVSYINGLRVVRVRWTDAGGRAQLAAAHPEAQIENNSQIFAPNIPAKSTEPGVANPKAFGIGGLEFIGVTADNTGWGKGVKIAILDTGITDHRLLNGVAITRVDLLGKEAAATGPYSGHGTAVASIIASQDTLIRGVAPAAQLLGIRVLDGDGVGDTFTLAQGIVEAVDRGANIINLSLGGNADSRALRDAVAYAETHGVLIIAAVGNDGNDAVLYPAAYDSVIAVSAVDANGDRPTFSNTGAAVDLAAPGTDVFSAWSDDLLIRFTGTSAAAPFVAGALAAAEAANPGMSAADIRTLALATANDAGTADDDPSYGEGIIDIQRMLQAGTPGIHDAAVASHVLPVDDGTDLADYEIPVAIVVENRGTATETMHLTATVANGSFEFNFANLAPGASATADLVIDGNKLQDAGSFQLNTTVTIPGEDQNPADNTRSSIIKLRQTEVK